MIGKSLRSAAVLTFTPSAAAAGRGVGHRPGQGRPAGRLGALIVETSQGQRFKLGGGFTDAQRSDPPAIGTWVTYRYNGTNPSGLPRFARFMRVRADAPS